MKIALMDYQKKASEFVLRNKKCMLMFDGGMGCHATVLNAINELRYDLLEQEKILVISSKHSIHTCWLEEIRKWSQFADLRYSVIEGKERDRLIAVAETADIYFANFETVAWLKKSGLFDFSTIILDELHSFKNVRSKRFMLLSVTFCYPGASGFQSD